MRMFNPPHPGLVLREYLPESLTLTAVAVHLHVSRSNLSMILHGRLGISPAFALKLSEALPNTTPEFWMRMQSGYDLAKQLRKKRKKLKPLSRVIAEFAEAA